jgi:hypothetical protein
MGAACGCCCHSTGSATHSTKYTEQELQHLLKVAVIDLPVATFAVAFAGDTSLDWIDPKKVFVRQTGDTSPRVSIGTATMVPRLVDGRKVFRMELTLDDTRSAARLVAPATDGWQPANGLKWAMSSDGESIETDLSHTAALAVLVRRMMAVGSWNPPEGDAFRDALPHHYVAVVEVIAPVDEPEDEEKGHSPPLLLLGR